MLTKDTNAEEMTNMMVGHAVTLNIERPEPVNSKPRLEVKGLTVRSQDGILKLDDVSFTLNSGEILGIAGISGCGQKELLEAMYSELPAPKKLLLQQRLRRLWMRRSPKKATMRMMPLARMPRPRRMPRNVPVYSGSRRAKKPNTMLHTPSIIISHQRL